MLVTLTSSIGFAACEDKARTGPDDDCPNFQWVPGKAPSDVGWNDATWTC